MEVARGSTFEAVRTFADIVRDRGGFTSGRALDSDTFALDHFAFNSSTGMFTACRTS